MKKIKITMLTTSYPRYEGDLRGIFIQKLVKNLNASNEVEVNIIQPKDKYPDLLAGEGIFKNLKTNTNAKLQFIPCMADFFARGIKNSKNCDIIHGNWVFSGLPGLIAKKIFRKPLLLTMRGGDLKPIHERSWIAKLYRFILRRADLIVCVSEQIKGELNRIIKIDCEMILNGIDNDIFKAINKLESRKKLKLKKDSLILTFSGRLTLDKGPLMLLKAFSKVKEKNLVLMFIGGGKIEENLKKVSKDLKIEDKVLFLGDIKHSEVPIYLSASDIYVFPRFFDSGGNTILEAASCGLPIIATNEGFVKDILNYKGIELIEKNEDDLLKAIKKLVKNKKLRIRLGKEARQQILNYGIGWKENSEKYLKLYKKLLSRN